jgi:hypothetical protein
MGRGMEMGMGMGMGMDMGMGMGMDMDMGMRMMPYGFAAFPHHLLGGIKASSSPKDPNIGIIRFV